MKAELLKRVPLFRGLSDVELGALAELMQVRKFPRDCMVIWAEDKGDTLFVMHTGRVKVSVNAADGREVILSVLGPGEFFGDMSLLDDRPRSANVITLEGSEVLAIRRSDFLQALEQYPSIAVHLMVSLALRLRRADRQIASLALLGITDRICGVLLALAEEQGVETEEGLVIRKRPTHQILANMAGTARETVTRVLSRLDQEGYILSRGRELVILRRDAAG